MAVQFRKVAGFNQLPLVEAKRLINEELLPACDKEGIVLSKYGNLVLDGQAPAPSHQQLPDKDLFFNIERVQEAYKIVMDIDSVEGFRPGFCKLKERVQAQVENIQDGELAVAILFRGHIADFHNPKTMSCDIKWKF